VQLAAVAFYPQKVYNDRPHKKYTQNENEFKKIMNRIKHFLMPHGGKLTTDMFSGLTVALALIPEAIAFALIANVDPLVGLHAAFFMCIITALFGGRPGMISGATGATAVVMVSLVNQYGIDYLFAAVILTGILQILVGILGLGKLIRIMPKSVMVGFVNGLAIVIFISQLGQFQNQVGPDQYEWLKGSELYIMLFLVGLAMAITHYLPRFTKLIPSALAAIITVYLVIHFTGIETKTVKDMLEGNVISSAYPSLYIPHVTLNLATLKIILPYAAILCVIGLSESLMTLSLIDEITQTRGQGNKECIAQGAGNIVCGVFKSMGGCAMIGQSMINVTSGGIGRLSGIFAAASLLLFLLFGWPIIQQTPIAALVGVMFMVVIETFEWATFNLLNKVPKHDALVIVVVTFVTVLTNLAVAVLAGIIMACLVFAWETAKKIRAESHMTIDGSKVYVLYGPLFFGSVTNFKALFNFDTDPDDITIDFMNSSVADHSAIDAIKTISEKYFAMGKTLHLKHLSPECVELLGKAKGIVDIVSVEYKPASYKLS